MISPFLIFFIGAVIYLVLPKRVGKLILLSIPFFAFISYLGLKEKTIELSFLREKIVLYNLDVLSYPFFIVFIIISFLGFLYGFHEDDKKDDLFPLLYAGSSVGLLCSGDFLTLFFFWELMALFSTLIILNAKKESSKKAGLRYLLVHLLCGFLLFCGIMLHYKVQGSFAFSPLNTNSLSGILILLGFIINAAVPPFSAWLPDAYPEAKIGGSVFLSAFTTKSAVYVLIKFFAGSKILVILGSIMAVYGVIYAFLVLDMRRLLSYHIISQVGFMVTGVGIGTELSINGAISHAFTHIVYKGLLFMSAGAIIFSTGKERLNELGGLLKNHKEIFIYYMIGALSISGAPLLSGFVSKSLTITAAQDEHHVFAWLMLNIASTGTFISVALKLPYLAFFGEDKIKSPEKLVPANMKTAMFIASAICVVIGILPQILYNIMPYRVDYRPYTAEHLIFVIELFCGGLIAFALYLKKLEAHRYYIILDTDWIYRKGIGTLLKIFYTLQDSVHWFINEIFYGKILNFLIWFTKNPMSALNLAYEWILYIFGFEEREFLTDIKKYPKDTYKHWPIGITIFYVTIFLLIFLITYYAF